MRTLEQQMVRAATRPIRSRNICLDCRYYDTDSLTVDERKKLLEMPDYEGSIIVVRPTGSSESIQHYDNAEQFIRRVGHTVGAIAVAGVGSSILGTAALARNVADAKQIDVAGIVSGYGMTDFWSEAFGGWFFYGYTDRFRYLMRQWVAQWTRALEAMSSAWIPQYERPETYETAKKAEVDRVRQTTTDVETLMKVLKAEPQNLRYLVGHSKGCLLIDYVLEGFVDRYGDGGAPYYDELRIVMLATVVDLPQRFQHRHQFLGSCDRLGRLNSRLSVPHKTIPGAKHHLNPKEKGHLSVADMLAKVP